MSIFEGDCVNEYVNLVAEKDIDPGLLGFAYSVTLPLG